MRLIRSFAVLFLALTAAATLAQTATNKTDGNTQAKSKPVSGYLRNMGIIFLEAVDELPSEADSAQEQQWDKGMDQLEDRISIAFSESPKRLSGDEPYWEMLKLTHWAHAMFLMTCHMDSKSATCEAFRTADLHCRLYAHDVALEGVIAFNSRNTCYADNEKALAIQHKEGH